MNMPAFDASRAVWRKSSRSNGSGGNCVEVSEVDSLLGVRDSKDKAGPVMVFTQTAWAAFIRQVHDGAFDR